MASFRGIRQAAPARRAEKRGMYNNPRAAIRAEQVLLAVIPTARNAERREKNVQYDVFDLGEKHSILPV